MKDNGKIAEVFAKNVFSDAEMKKRLPDEIYCELKKRIGENHPLDLEIANAVADEMKNWALEMGATHYTHWFQPMTGVTAEKHDSFLNVKDGEPILSFNGKSLVKGESDASSFPSGGLRATFEARGYTTWDPTSYAFVKDETLYIPTAFCSYGGEALDKKTPLLRSMEVIDKKARRLLGVLGIDAGKVTPTVGAEQEYFLISKDVYEKRRDLFVCGRTLFGARPSKGQELDDHYFGKIKKQVMDFMSELDKELWSLGIYSKTKHNEAAPAQHELAPIFESANIATDHNQLTMAVMKEVANRHEMVCLLHEKPFDRVAGSGKHNNWALSTDTGLNLLKPGKTPYDNKLFLLVLTAVIKAVDEYQDLLRISVASPSNDHRLGANEAPPAIVSMFLGEEIEGILDSIESGEEYKPKRVEEMETGVSVITHFNKDKTDRNRTSPFAFTGNKFEFRMLGSMQSIAEPNIVLNTAVGDIFGRFADELEKCEDKDEGVLNIVRREYSAHKRIIFNGNNYSPEWVKEAEQRGLSNYATTVDAVTHLTDQKNVDLFVRNGVYAIAELKSRCEIVLENYHKQIAIECETMRDMLKKEIVPGVLSYKKAICEEIDYANRTLGAGKYETNLYTKINSLTNELYYKEQALDSAHNVLLDTTGDYERAVICRDVVIPAMNEVRVIVDELETIVGKNYMTIPDYLDILYSVKY